SFLAPDGGKCAQFDGSASYINLYAAQPAQPTAIGSISLWAATPDANISGTTKMQLIKLGVDNDNNLEIAFDTTAYRFVGSYEGGGTTDSATGLLYNKTDYGPDWNHFGLTWTKAGDAMKFYINGLQQGSTQTGLDTWTGNMASTLMVLGSSVTTGADLLTGYLARLGIWSVVLTADDMADLAVIGP
ncbi:MAG: hypothetical protein KAI94_13050, partial [Anaerolineales bacterium]|nr:hypothetical protein [Anaerolineales bacterium]